MKVIFSSHGWEDYRYWPGLDQKIFDRINMLIEASRRQPFFGIGKPEPLKGTLKGLWSRRITREHRMLYRVTGKGESRAIEIIQLRFHY